MRPKSITVTSANSPYHIPLNWRGGPTGVSAAPGAEGDYDVEFTQESLLGGIDEVSTWSAIEDMSGATTAQVKELGPATCLRVTLNSGDSVTVSLAQSDV